MADFFTGVTREAILNQIKNDCNTNLDMADFCTRVTSEAILNQIKNGCNKNLVLSPLALKCMLNMLGSGSTGQTLEQILSFLDSKTLSDLNLDSLKMINLVSMREEESEPPHRQGPVLSFLDGGRNRMNPSLATWSGGRRPIDLQRQGPVLSFVNGVWIDFRLRMNPSFERTAREVYRADAREVDFQLKGEQVRKEVNSWAEKETRGLIKDFLSKGSCNDVMLLLANALYFKGSWRYPFQSYLTRDEPFYHIDGSSVKVPFMKKTREFQFFGSFPGCKILKLPYKTSRPSGFKTLKRPYNSLPPPSDNNRQFSMYFFLPDATDGLQGLIQEMNSNPGLLRSALQEVKLSKIWVPKFKFSYSFEASDTLQKMGLTLPFKVDAELEGMIDDSSALPYEHNVTKMIQKCFIEVNEEGTEAAACTAYQLSGCAMQRVKEAPLPCFVADHPFLFLIKEEASESVVFSGAVLNPLS